MIYVKRGVDFDHLRAYLGFVQIQRGCDENHKII